MRKAFIILAVLLLILFFLGCCQRPPEPPPPPPDGDIGAGDYTFTIEHNGATRKYFVHVPSSYDASVQTPVLLNFHGGAGSAQGHATNTEMNAKSDEEGFIAVHPAGTRRDLDPNRQYQRFWNLGPGPDDPYYDPGDPIGEVDDIGFVNKILDELESNFNVDEKRVYVTGLSNGGFLIHYLACELSDRIAAIAPIACVFFTIPADCNPSRAVSVIQFHGTDDRCVLYDGGPSECGQEKLDRVFISAAESIAIWAEKNNCSSTPIVTYQNGDVTCETYGNCDEGAEVVLCTIEGGGHTWPGGRPYTIPGLDIGPVTYDISANDAMWEFFESHPIP